MLFLALILAVLAVILFRSAARSRAQLGVPSGRVIYADTRGWREVPKPLYDPLADLTGRPDYLVEQVGQFIPVEVKSSRAREEPYEEHIFQLAAYCYLVAKIYGKRPDYGILHYPNRTFTVDFTPHLEAAMLDLLAEMRSRARRKDVPRSHDFPARCGKCGFRAVCDEKL